VLLAGSVALSQPKIGYVNSSKIFQEIPEAQDAQRRIDAMTKPVEDSIAALQKQLQDKFEEYRKKESMMTDAAKRSAQDELQALQVRAREYAQEKDTELSKQRDRIIEPLKEKILRAIEQVAKAEKYTFVFDQTETVRVLLYGDPREDLTNRVIDKLKRGK
jgi:outer membrane protein